MKERVVLVTGASRGIGRAIAEKFAQRGDRVFGTARQPESVKWTAGTLLALDVQDERSFAQCVESLLSQTQRIDVLVNNAGINFYGAIEELDLAEVMSVRIEPDRSGIVIPKAGFRTSRVQPGSFLPPTNRMWPNITSPKIS